MHIDLIVLFNFFFGFFKTLTYTFLSPSKTLTACGIDDQLASKTVRFSFGRQTTIEDIERVMSELSSIVFLSKYGTSLLGAFSKGPIPGF